tara:strand:- start:320 stop:1195 length:876 start_codon:yes stop_codon:yes gene_type:complete
MRIVLNALRSFSRRKDPVEAFFKQAYEQRVDSIKKIYSHSAMKQRMIDFIDESADLKSNTQHFFDYVAAYSKLLEIQQLQQIGCFLATESKVAIDEGFNGALVATDFDHERIDFLRSIYKDTAYRRIIFKHQDLENAKAEDFLGSQLVVAQAVLSNIQPEAMDQIFSALAKSSVQCVLIGDVYVKETLGFGAKKLASIRSPNDRNWFHPFMQLGRRNGFDAFFLPDFSYSSFKVARGIFVLHRGIPDDVHSNAAAMANKRYRHRQDLIWKVYGSISIDKHWKKGELANAQK